VATGRGSCVLQLRPGSGPTATWQTVVGARGVESTTNVLTDELLDYEQPEAAGVLPRWLVTALNVVVVGGVAATVSVALLGMRRTESLPRDSSLEHPASSPSRSRIRVRHLM
jgi:hypothetical protein